MIQSKKDFKLYMRMDAIALGEKADKKVVLVGKEVWRFERVLRHLEYHLNITHNPVKSFFWSMRHRHLQLKLGFVIPANVFGGGLRINHFGNIVVNSGAKIGNWCDIHQGVNIGTGYDGCPIIGENVWIGPGAKIYGRINIADRIAIGANAVVSKPAETPGVTIAGVPAKKISDKGNHYLRKLE